MSRQILDSLDKILSADDIRKFLPAAIEIEQTPASPAGQAIIWGIVLLFSIAVIWSVYGEIDIIATAQGRVIPKEGTKQIQPLEAGKVKAIHVYEGQLVKAGDLLISLDQASTQSDVQRVQHELNVRTTELQRLKAMEDWFQSGMNEVVSVSLPFMQQELFEQHRAELRSRLQALDSDVEKQLAEKDMVQAEVDKNLRVIPLLRERVDALDRLQQKQLGSRVQYLELMQQLIEQEHSLKLQLARLNQLNASIEGSRKQVSTLCYEQRKQNLATLNTTALTIASLQQDLIKAVERNDQQILKSPINGRVQQLSVHTVGGVVTVAQTLMIVVPEQSRLEVEVHILNKDIGFINEGQSVQVKIDTFNFTKYGLIDAEILSISDDAIQDENLGLIYSARIKLKQDSIKVDGNWVKLWPGMSVISEIRTGKRRIIEYFLSPLLRYQQESLGER